MTGLSWAALALAVAGVVFGLWQWRRRQYILRRLNAMLERAIAGGFAEECFDETELSALEGKLARFLRGSARAKKTMEGEQAAVKALIADISHQTRTPISNLLLYSSLLLESDLPAQQQEQARAIMVQGEKLSFLIQTLVKASRLETGIVIPAPSPHSVGALLEDAVQQEEQDAREKAITLRALPFAGTAVFDSRWTSEALGNVLNNAVKYTPAGGAVTICAQMLGTFCRIDVTDTGPGVPEGEQAEIFNRFYRGAGVRTAEGLGLGLYLAREILTLQGGYIKVSSGAGQGCTFSLFLPKEPEQA
ncbi:MAG: HAMP domain-containing sensor histidine kinase [Eubacteriales bacterium]|nr:HAMP domain-containing sensor histidine kinase [Eubacteriales bacterium]